MVYEFNDVKRLLNCKKNFIFLSCSNSTLCALKGKISGLI